MRSVYTREKFGQLFPEVCGASGTNIWERDCLRPSSGTKMRHTQNFILGLVLLFYGFRSNFKTSYLF
jgi:hypothetical protein